MQSARLPLSLGRAMKPLHLQRATIRILASHCNAAARSYSTLLQSSGRPAAFRSSLSASPRPAASLFRRGLFIQTQSTPNPNSLKFLPGRDVSPARQADFNSYREASRQSPLAAALLSIEGVSSVYLGSDFLSVNVVDGAQWSLVKPEVFAAIMDFFASGKPVLVESAEEAATISSTTILESDSEVVALIKELIETRIRPAVQEDGGDIDFIDFDEVSGKVRVQMQGACKGCSSSAITLKNGIENMLRHYVPEVSEVEEFVDEELHAVSEEQLKKLEDKLEKAKTEGAVHPTASPV